MNFPIKPISSLCFSLLFLLTPNFSTGQIREMNSQIEAVTVFLSGAQITRKASTQLPSGETTLKLSALSPYMDKKSLRVEGDGPFTILSVSHQLNYLDSLERRKELTLLQNRRAQLIEDSTRICAMRRVFELEEQMLLKNQALKGEQNSLDVATLEAALSFHRKQMTEVLLQQNTYTKELEEIRKLLMKVDKQLSGLKEEKDEPSSEILVKVNAADATTANFSITYIVSKAGWFSRYDVRADDISEPLNLHHKAQVFQQCGEDWERVKLTLSSGNPSEGGNAPTLGTWLLDGPSTSYYVPYEDNRSYPSAASLGITEISGQVYDEGGKAIQGVVVLFAGTTVGTFTDEKGSFSLMTPPDARKIEVNMIGYRTQKLGLQKQPYQVLMEPAELELEEVMITGLGSRSLNGQVAGVNVRNADRSKRKVSIRGYSSQSFPLETEVALRGNQLSFEIQDPYSIPSDGKLYEVDIAQHRIATKYEYLTIPKLDTDAFLVARLLNWEELNLVSGEANLFLEGTFLGKSLINPDQTRDTMKLSLGRDRSVGVSRDLKKEFTEKKIVGNNQIETQTWEIRIRNNKKQAVSLKVEDQIPISTHNRIDVRELSHEGAELDDAGKLTWRLQLAPGETRTLEFSYEVKYPKGWNIRL